MYKNTLVDVDGNDQANLAYERAIEVVCQNGNRAIVANILEDQVCTMMGYPALNDQLIDQETVAMEELMTDYKKYTEDVNSYNVEAATIFGSPKEVMSHKLPGECSVDLIMIGQSGLNTVERVVIESVSSYTIRQVPCDVLIARSEEK